MRAISGAWRASSTSGTSPKPISRLAAAVSATSAHSMLVGAAAGSSALAAAGLRAQLPGDIARAGRRRQDDQRRHPRQRRQQRQDDRHRRPAAGARKLRRHLPGEALVGGHARHHHGGGNRQQQRRHLRDQPIADGEQHIGRAPPRRCGRSCCTVPRISPPMMLMARISMPATASPFTNFEAPSIEP